MFDHYQLSYALFTLALAVWSKAVYEQQVITFVQSFIAFSTRDPKELAECDVVVDVGGEFDHSKKRYDHHQKFVDNFGIQMQIRTECFCLQDIQRNYAVVGDSRLFYETQLRRLSICVLW